MEDWRTVEYCIVDCHSAGAVHRVHVRATPVSYVIFLAKYLFIIGLDTCFDLLLEDEEFRVCK